MWLWNRDSEFTKWQHPAMWQVALGWHAMEFAQTSAILEFYIWFRFWSYHRSRHVILHESAKFYPNRTTLSKKMTSCRFSRWRISVILDFRGPIMGSLKSPCTTSVRSYCAVQKKSWNYSYKAAFHYSSQLQTWSKTWSQAGRKPAANLLKTGFF